MFTDKVREGQMLRLVRHSFDRGKLWGVFTSIVSKVIKAYVICPKCAPRLYRKPPLIYEAGLIKYRKEGGKNNERY